MTLSPRSARASIRAVSARSPPPPQAGAPENGKPCVELKDDATRLLGTKSRQSSKKTNAGRDLWVVRMRGYVRLCSGVRICAFADTHLGKWKPVFASEYHGC
eukprot:6200933-Pleurochrysis_carterae.AAC.3